MQISINFFCKSGNFVSGNHVSEGTRPTPSLLGWANKDRGFFSQVQETLEVR